MKKYLYFIYAFVSLVIATSCSKSEDHGNQEGAITVNGEAWGLDPFMTASFIKYGDDSSTYGDQMGDYNYSIDFQGYVVGREDETGGPDYSFEIRFLKETMPEKDCDLTAYNFRAERYDCLYKYKSGKVIVSNKSKSKITIRFDRLVLEAVDEVPYYATEKQVIDGTLTLKLDI